MTLRCARAIAIAFAAYRRRRGVRRPLAIKLGGVPHDPGDPLLTTWFLWWDTQAIPLTARWWNAPMFFPAPGAFAFSEHLLGLTPIAVPFTLLTGQPLVGHNIAFIATYVLGALGAHFLAYALTKRHDVSAIAALAFAFAPYRLPQAPHIQVLASFWTPVYWARCTATRRHGACAGSRSPPHRGCCRHSAAATSPCSHGARSAVVSVVRGRRWPVRRQPVAARPSPPASWRLPLLRGYQFFLRDT